MLLILTLVLTGCMPTETEGKTGATETTTAAEATDSGEELLLSVGSDGLSMKYARVFALSQKNQYEQAFGDEIWSVRYKDGTFEDYLLSGFRAHIALMYSSYVLAKERGLTVGSGVERELREAASNCYLELEPADMSELDITEADLLDIFEMYYLAKKVYTEISGDAELMLSEDETRVVRLQEIRIKTKDLPDDEKDKKMTLIAEAKNSLEAGDDFNTVAAKYSETGTTVYSASRDNLSAAEAKAVFDLASGEVSQVITLNDAYVIFRCVDSFDKEASRANRTESLERLCDERFKNELSDYLNTHPLTWNEAAWQKIDMSEAAGIESFNIYSEYTKRFGGE